MIFLVLVILSAAVERCFVFRMRDFYFETELKNQSANSNISVSTAILLIITAYSLLLSKESNLAVISIKCKLIRFTRDVPTHLTLRESNSLESCSTNKLRTQENLRVGMTYIPPSSPTLHHPHLNTNCTILKKNKILFSATKHCVS